MHIHVHSAQWTTSQHNICTEILYIKSYINRSIKSYINRSLIMCIILQYHQLHTMHTSGWYWRSGTTLDFKLSHPRRLKLVSIKEYANRVLSNHIVMPVPKYMWPIYSKAPNNRHVHNYGPTIHRWIYWLQKFKSYRGCLKSLQQWSNLQLTYYHNNCTQCPQGTISKMVNTTKYWIIKVNTNSRL